MCVGGVWYACVSSRLSVVPPVSVCVCEESVWAGFGMRASLAGSVLFPSRRYCLVCEVRVCEGEVWYACLSCRLRVVPKGRVWCVVCVRGGLVCVPLLQVRCCSPRESVCGVCGVCVGVVWYASLSSRLGVVPPGSHHGPGGVLGEPGRLPASSHPHLDGSRQPTRLRSRSVNGSASRSS